MSVPPSVPCGRRRAGLFYFPASALYFSIHMTRFRSNLSASGRYLRSPSMYPFHESGHSTSSVFSSIIEKYPSLSVAVKRYPPDSVICICGIYGFTGIGTAFVGAGGAVRFFGFRLRRLGRGGIGSGHGLRHRIGFRRRNRRRRRHGVSRILRVGLRFRLRFIPGLRCVRRITRGIRIGGNAFRHGRRYGRRGR